MGGRYFLKHQVVVLGNVLPVGILLANDRRGADASTQRHTPRGFDFCFCCHRLVWLLLFAAPDAFGELLSLVWVSRASNGPGDVKSPGAADSRERWLSPGK
jgi:hypothetical protein